MCSFRSLLSSVYLASFILLISIWPALAGAPVIRWEIENRFRYFKRASDFREIANVYDKLAKENPRPSAVQLEKALERAEPSSLDGWAAKYFKYTCGKRADPHLF